VGKTTNRLSHLDYGGYLLTANIEFGQSVPDIANAWLAQYGSITSKLLGRFSHRELSEFRIRQSFTVNLLAPALIGYAAIRTMFQLTWQMVGVDFAASTPASLAILRQLPDEIHVFVEIPTLDSLRVAEPRIYWSTDPNSTETDLIPRGAMKIVTYWDPRADLVSWQQHHYDVAKSVQERHGFDPSSTAAAEALGLPILEIPDPDAQQILRGKLFSLLRNSSAN
jgi:hypothetical protein